jgi:hypothetical protein
MVATPETIPTDLTLEIEADLSPDQFVAAARAFFGYIEDLSETQFYPLAPRWVVRVKEGSALLGVEPATDIPPEIFQNILARTEESIERVAAGDIEDAGVPDSALRHLRALAELADHRAVFRVWVRRRPIPVDHRIADAIREDERTDYRDYGTVEGRLEAIQEKRGSLQFRVRDSLLSIVVNCYFPENLLPEVFKSFRKRVEVSGMIHYRKNGKPISIEATSIVQLPDDSELPTADDVRGILSS